MTTDIVYEIYTAKIHNRQALEDRDIVPVDTTVMTGMKSLAPDWGLLKAYKSGEIDQHTYTTRYIERMRETYHSAFDDWLSVLSIGRVGLMCYCKPHAFCHRLILKEMLLRLHTNAGHQVMDGGEVVS